MSRKIECVCESLSAAGHSDFHLHAHDITSGMNKTYLRYELSHTFGLVASPQSNAVYDATGNLGISAALHDVAVWNLRQCSLVRGQHTPLRVPGIGLLLSVTIQW